MVRFFQKIGELARGESQSEGEERRRFEKELRAEARKAEFEARKIETVKFAQRKAALRREAAEASLRRRLAPPQRPQYVAPRSATFDFMGGAVRTSGGEHYVGGRRRGKKSKHKRRMQYNYQSAPRQERRFDVLGF